MRIAILGDENTKKLISQKGIPDDVEILWCGSVRVLVATVADAYFDFLFINDKSRVQQYKMRDGFPFYISCVEYLSKDIAPFLVRFNGWNSFFERSLVELVVQNELQEEFTHRVFKKLQWDFRKVSDLRGMVSARIVVSIINEAYFTVGEGISTKDEVDIAMKLGTNYPFGPFEWARTIGLDKVHSLLFEMNKEDRRMEIAPTLDKEIRNTIIQ